MWVEFCIDLDFILQQVRQKASKMFQISHGCSAFKLSSTLAIELLLLLFQFGIWCVCWWYCHCLS